MRGWKKSIDVLVLVLGFGLTIVVWKFTQNIIYDHQQAEYRSNASKITQSIQLHLQAYTQVLKGIQGLYAASVTVEPVDFRKYIETVNVRNLYPGAYSFTHVTKVSDALAVKFLKQLQKDLGASASVSSQLAASPDHYIVDDVVIETGGLAPGSYGLDLQLDATRSSTLKKARDTGHSAASGPLILRGPNKPGFIITMPIYQKDAATDTLAQRQKALQGFVNIAFIYQDLMPALTDILPDSGLAVVIADDNQVIFDSAAGGSQQSGWTKISGQTLEVAGRKWQLEYFAPPLALNTLENNLALFVLLGGVTVSALLFTVTLILRSTGMRADYLAEQMTEELRKFKLAVENASDHIVITDTDGKILFANKAVTNITGYSQSEILGQRPSLWGGQMPKEYYQKMWETIKTKKQIFSGEVINRRKNGELYPAAVSITPVVDRASTVDFFVGIERDVSKEQKDKVAIQAQLDELKKLNEVMVGRELKMVELKQEIAKLKGSKVS